MKFCCFFSERVLVLPPPKPAAVQVREDGANKLVFRDTLPASQLGVQFLCGARSRSARSNRAGRVSVHAPRVRRPGPWGINGGRTRERLAKAEHE